MGRGHVFIICSFFVFVTQGQVTLETDRPWLRVKHLHTAVLECCYRTNEEVKISWVVRVTNSNRTIVPRNVVNASELVTFGDKITSPTRCGTLTLISVQYSDSGLYQCVLNGGIDTPGTYLQVYKPLEKTINLSENTKNDILIAEGILLLLCVLVPSGALLCKSKKLHELDKKKVMMEEENIYQGLNLDDCCTPYDQIQRSKPDYQDVGNVIAEEDEIQLEKP